MTQRCEDFPCCGHGPDDCPRFDRDSGMLPYPCIGCGKAIPRDETVSGHESYCSKCISDPGTFCEGPDCPGCSGCMGNDDDEEDGDADAERASDEFDAVAKCGVGGCDQPGTARNGLCRDCAYEGDCDSQASRREG